MCYTVVIMDVMGLSPALQEQINRAIVILKNGGIVAYPADTVYGLGASMNSLAAIERIFEVKGRPKGMALPLLTADIEQIEQITTAIPETARCLIERFMPGALTIILPGANTVPNIITAGGATVAVRIPNHAVPLALIRGLGKPIVGTSANLTGKPSALTAEEVRSQLGGKVDMIIDGGRCPGGIESTVIDLTTDRPFIRRKGALSVEQLRQACPEIGPAEEVADANRSR